MERRSCFAIDIKRVMQRLARDTGEQITLEQAEAYLSSLGFRRESVLWSGPTLKALELRGDEYRMIPKEDADAATRVSDARRTDA